MYLDVHKEAEGNMKKTISAYREELQSIRAGRANPTLLDKIMVESYGQMTPLKQIGSISAPEARLITIQPWDPNLISEIEKAILRSDLGLNPSNDGKIIRLIIPMLTEERRLDLIKVVKKNGENAKVVIRNIRRDQNDKIKKMEKDKEISEDERKTAEITMQEITDKFIKEVDEITKTKEEELIEI